MVLHIFSWFAIDRVVGRQILAAAGNPAGSSNVI